MEKSTEIEIVRARPEDHSRLSQLAAASKRYWGYPLDWMDQWHSLLTITPEYIRDHEVYAARSGDEVLAFYALAGRPPVLLLDHLWVAPDTIGRGIGRRLFAHALEQAAHLGAQTLEIESDPNAAGFYRRMGARQVGEIQSQMERNLPIFVFDIHPGDE